MPSSKEYLNYILEQLAPLEEIAYRPMMGEYILYYRGKVVGGIYDDRLLVKPVKSAVTYLPAAPRELPYDGAKEMLLVVEVAGNSCEDCCGRWSRSCLLRSQKSQRPPRQRRSDAAWQGGSPCCGA